MKIRRYIAKNTQEAILKVKMDLGNEALILNTRKVKKKGLIGLFSKPMVEVLAAIDEYDTTKADTVKSSERPGVPEITPEEKKFDEKEEKIANLENKITNIENMISSLFQQAPSDNKPVRQQVNPTQAQRSSGIVNVFYNNLLKNDVEQDIARRIVDTVSNKLSEDAGFDDVALQLSGVISGLLGKPETIGAGEAGKPKVAIFVGPTGVGKTTTLAKIAANYMLSQKKSIGLITADTYRIAAVEQLKTYAEILDIPVCVAYTAAELSEAVKKNSDKDLVLIDTAGRSHKNKAQFEELKSFVSASGADEIYLLLSSTTSSRSCREILNSYSFLPDYKLIFTKLDEASTSGIILNVRYLTGKSLSYVTTGQSVPDDIETVNIDKITKNLMGSIN
ncbi:MAG: flagellar biosynthesis protein FlhF [Clostridiaceae bacterium]|jgi:flagellar biosynthesis protein FlhF|nr:flagellar biosynthesis protein FlhF [Clostridiaceae bacterium]